MNSEILSNDFITIWSKYLIEKDYKKIDADLMALSELKCPEAIFQWYTFNSISKNHAINILVNDLPEDDFDNLMAIASKEYTSSSNSLNYLLNELKDAYYNRNINCFSNFMYWDKKAKDIESRMMSYPHFQTLRHALNLVQNRCKAEPMNIYSHQKCAECLYFLAETMPFVNISNYYKDSANNYNNIVLKHTLKAYKKSLKSGEPLTDKQIFVLAKSLMYKGKKKDIILAKQLLKPLAERKLSEELTKFKTNHIYQIKPLDKQG